MLKLPKQHFWHAPQQKIGFQPRNQLWGHAAQRTNSIVFYLPHFPLANGVFLRIKIAS